MKIRTVMEKILPDSWVPYILHLRPRAWPIVAAHMSAGFFLANGFTFGSDTLQRLLIAILTWTILGNGGTLAINSYYDQDEGDIGYLDDPPTPPKYLHLFSLLLMVLGLPLAAYLGSRFLIVYTICMTLSVIYSVPPMRAKARGGIDVLINSIGYGGLTFYAGWAALNRPFDATIINVVLGFMFLFAGFYPLTQIYQMEEDRRRGDNTLAVRLDKRNALRFAAAAVIIAFVFFVGEVTARYFELRALGILISLLLWGVFLIHWNTHYASVDNAYEKKGFYKALWIWAVTDISVVVAMAPLLFTSS
ncbi:MAG: UbiA prenyltransferase family protein [Anaerolineales bacterium]|nr:UbiA prenyltransferase family protein [Anaerolineales bacterium]